MKLTKRCSQEFNQNDRKRGQQYFLDDRVFLEDDFDIANQVVHADVEGSLDELYNIEIDWSEVALGFLSVRCSCPRYADGYNCKHLWATILELDRQGVSESIPGTNRLDIDEMIPLADATGSLLSNVVEMAQVGGTRTASRKVAKKKKKGNRKSLVIPANWHQALQGIERYAANGSEPTKSPWDALKTKQREAWYVFNIRRIVAESKMIVELFQRETKNDGQFGKFKKLNIESKIVDGFSDRADRELLSLLLENSQWSSDDYGYRYRYSSYSSSFSSIALPFSLREYLLPKISATGRFVWLLDSEMPLESANPLVWDGSEPWQFRLQVTPDDVEKQWVVTGHYSRRGKTCPMSACTLASESGYLLMDDTLAPFDANGAEAWIDSLYQLSEIHVPYADRDHFLKRLCASGPWPSIEWPESLRLEEIHESPLPKLKVHAPKESGRENLLYADVSFLYRGHEIKASDSRDGMIVDESNKKPQASGPKKEKAGKRLAQKNAKKNATKNTASQFLKRDHEQEAKYIAELQAFPVRPVPPYNSYCSERGSLQFHGKHLASMVDQLIEKNWQIEAEGKLFRSAGSFHIEVTSDIDWFELDAAFDFEGVEAKLPELLAAVRKGDRYVELGDGTRGILPQKWLDQYAQLANLGEMKEGTVRFAPSQALLLDVMLAEQDNVRLDRKFTRFRDRLHSFKGVKPKSAPKTFQGKLRKYQEEGLGWFHFLRDIGCGGCLADDMGLGKTIQVLALLEGRRLRRLKKGEVRRPSLVVVPKSLVFNWIDEAAKFTPKLRVLDYTGIDRKDRLAESSDFHLMVTTYGTLRIDIGQLKEQRFDYAILDESQAIKNASSQAAKASRLLASDHRLALTGTPIENHLGELWSLFEYLNPGMLGRSSAFTSFSKEASRGDRDSLKDLSRAISPFILRRTKEKVLKELPAKTEQTLYCELSPKERKAYNELRNYYRAKLTKKIGEKGLDRSKIHVLEALLRLRQASCHMGLVDRKKVNQSSAKLDTLMDQLREIVDEGHKVLVFSQFTSLLAIVRKSLDQEGICYEYLDGRTRKRKEKVDRFQSDATCPLFLISLKAGGHGLNLTAADYVFILDPWWNPAVEAQAIDRTHRMGQKNRVFAYRIIAKDTVEEKVLKLQDTKRELADAIIGANDSLIRKMTAEDLEAILS